MARTTNDQRGAMPRTLPRLVFRGMSHELLRLLRLTFRGSGKLVTRVLGHPLTWLLPLLPLIARCSTAPGRL